MKYSWLFVLGFILVSCSDSTPRRPVNKSTTKKKNFSIELNKNLNKIEEKRIQEYVVKDSLLNYKNSSFGFVYATLNSSKEKQKRVSKGSEVVFLKTVYSLKDKLIYAQKEETCVMGKSNQIRGIEEGLKLMQEDDEIKFIFSSFVAYGFNGDDIKIGRNTPIIVNIKLLKINN